MKTVEEGIRDAIAKKMEDGTIEASIEAALEKSINKSVEDLFDSYGVVGKSIKENLKSVMIPYLEQYDYSEYIVKLDQVMVDVLKNVSKDNVTILENFKSLMNHEEIKEVYTATEIFEKWAEYVKEEVSTDDLEVEYHDEPCYESVTIKLEAEEDEGRSWSSFKHTVLYLECEKDETMNREIPLSMWKDGNAGQKGEHDMRFEAYDSLSSLQNLDEFTIFLMKLSQNNSRIKIDEEYITDDVEPNEKPEPTFG